VQPLRAIPNPLLLEIPVRPWLRALSAEAGRPLTLAQVPDATLDAIAGRGFDAVWLMGAWRTGAAGRALALSIAELCRAYESVLPDWQPADVDGSPYSIASYRVGAALGGDDALAALRERLRARGVRLVLDFVPNHVARDHPWLSEHPARFVRGSARDLARDPGNWFVHTTPAGEDFVFAHGRDPWFPGWTDTAQLDYREPQTRRAMTETLVDVAARCDGMRCDMAMLVLPDVFRSTWGGSSDACFWSEAIPALRREHPDAWLMAEVYWGLEERLHALGFDATYDKELCDRLLAKDAPAVRERIRRPEETHRHRVRFLENHDEARAMTAFGPERTRAAAAAAYTLPGIRFFFEGQAEGRRARVPIQLGRAPREDVALECRDFYERLLRLLGRETLRRGGWSPLDLPDPGPLVGSRWTSNDETIAVVANLGDAPATARIVLDVRDAGGTAVVEDLASGERFERTRAELRAGVEWTVPSGGARFLRVAAA
jgi:glycosidase